MGLLACSTAKENVWRAGRFVPEAAGVMANRHVGAHRLVGQDGPGAARRLGSLKGGGSVESHARSSGMAWVNLIHKMTPSSLQSNPPCGTEALGAGGWGPIS